MTTTTKRTTKRHVISGVLVAAEDLHIGSGEEAESGEFAAFVRDGAGRTYLPGSTLAGALSRVIAKDDTTVWGSGEEDGNSSCVAIGHALPQGVPSTGVRTQHLRDRVTGAPRDAALYAYEYVPEGTRFSIKLTVSERGVDRRELVNSVSAALRGGVRIGADVTSALGTVRWAEEPEVKTFELDHRAGILAAILGQPVRTWQPNTRTPAPTRSVLTATITWRPVAVVMSQQALNDSAFDSLPAVTQIGDCVHPHLTGRSIRGAVRSRAGWICRTLDEGSEHALALDNYFGTATDTPAPEAQLTTEAATYPVVADLFGRASDHRGTGRSTGGSGWLRVSGTRTTTGIASAEWRNLLRCAGHLRQNETDLGARRALAERLDTINESLAEAKAGWGLAHVTRVAIDRWLGGAVKGALFTLLEPHAWSDKAWRPMQWELDLTRTDDDARRRAALALFLLLLRDLRDGEIPLGFATARGFGSVTVSGIEVEGAEEFHGSASTRLDDVLASLGNEVAEAWTAAIGAWDRTTEGAS